LRERRGRENLNRQLFAQTPEQLTEDVAINIFGEKAKELT